MSPLSNVKKGYDYKPPPLPSYSPTVTTPIPHHQHHLLHQSVPPLVPEYQPASDFRPQHAEYLSPHPRVKSHHLPTYASTEPSHKPPTREYLPPDTSYISHMSEYEPPSQEYLPPSRPEYVASSPVFDLPNLEYLPPPKGHN